MELNTIYDNRFSTEDREAKDAIWRVLCRHFFQRYVPRDATVLDLGAGFCEFLRHIECKERIAVDLNQQVSEFAPIGTKVIVSPSQSLRDKIDDNSIDIVFVSNFFEHLASKEIFIATLAEVYRILRSGGKILVLQPNIRALGGRYWDFVDHHIPLTDRTLEEALAMVGFDVTEVRPRFLPYTTRSRVPQSPILVRLYLMFPPIWRVMGGQTWVVATKPQGTE
jgi:SAM-dependent methyltransferase